MREKRPDSALDSITFRLRRCVCLAPSSAEITEARFSRNRKLLCTLIHLRERASTHAHPCRKNGETAEKTSLGRRGVGARLGDDTAAPATQRHFALSIDALRGRSAPRANVECDMEKSIKAVIRKQVRLESMTEHLRSWIETRRKSTHSRLAVRAPFISASSHLGRRRRALPAPATPVPGPSARLSARLSSSLSFLLFHPSAGAPAIFSALAVPAVRHTSVALATIQPFDVEVFCISVGFCSAS